MLDSVMGGGSLFGAVGGIVGEMFGGPLGAMIGQALGNMVQQAVGDGFKGAVDDLQQNHGMPSFLASELKDKADSVTSSLQNNDVSSEAQQAAQGQYGGAMQDFQKQFEQNLVKSILQNMGDPDNKPNGKGGGTRGGGWLQAIAKAMGTTLGQKAAEMVHLSKEMSDLQSSGSSSDSANAQQFNMDMTEFQATSQEYGILQNTFTNAIKSLGDALSGMARKN
jgi:hypothetical protein